MSKKSKKASKSTKSLCVKVKDEPLWLQKYVWTNSDSHRERKQGELSCEEEVTRIPAVLISADTILLHKTTTSESAASLTRSTV